MRQGRFQVITAMVIFGSIGLFRRFIPYSSGMIALVRGIIGVLFLLAIRLLRHEKNDTAAIRQNLILLLLSGACIGFNWILLFEAYRFTTVSVATTCYYMAPVFVTIFSPLLLKEKTSTGKIICILLAVAGMALVSGLGGSGSADIKGVLLALGAAVLYSCVVLLNKRISKLSGSERTLWQLGSAALVLLPYVLLTESSDVQALVPSALVLLLIVGIIHTGLAYALYFDGISRIPAQSAAILSYIDPIVAVFLSATVLHEAITLTCAIGIILVIGSALLSETVFSRS